MLPMWRTAATIRNRSYCSACEKPTISKAFLEWGQQTGFSRAKIKPTYKEGIPVILIIDAVNLPPAPVQEFIVFDVPIQQQ